MKQQGALQKVAQVHKVIPIRIPPELNSETVSVILPN
jgi:hypothetical protein